MKAVDNGMNGYAGFSLHQIQCSFLAHFKNGLYEVPHRQSLCGSLPSSTSIMTTQRIKLREDVNFRILRLLQDNPEMSQRELAKALKERK